MTLAWHLQMTLENDTQVMWGTLVIKKDDIRWHTLTHSDVWWSVSKCNNSKCNHMMTHGHWSKWNGSQVTWWHEMQKSVKSHDDIGSHNDTKCKKVRSHMMTQGAAQQRGRQMGITAAPPFSPDSSFDFIPFSRAYEAEKYWPWALNSASRAATSAPFFV